MTHLRRFSRWLGLRLVAWSEPRRTFKAAPYVPAHPSVALLFAKPVTDTAVAAAVRAAYADRGLPIDQFTPDFDLANAGKLYEVLHAAAERLALDHRTRTVGDIMRILTAAKRGAA